MNIRFGGALIVLVLGQTLFLGAMIWDRVTLLRSPDVVTLKTAPVDPRDIFRGDYVVLNYDISQLILDELAGDDEFTDGDTVHVELAPGTETWTAVGAWRDRPEPADGNKIIRGRIVYVFENRPIARTADDMEAEPGAPCPGCTTATILYGIESYFVPEGEGRVLEDERNAGSLTVDVALGRSGTAAIKGLRLDGEPIYEEPLF
jgi:uncharacterized membrane-anchored protein